MEFPLQRVFPPKGGTPNSKCSVSINYQTFLLTILLGIHSIYFAPHLSFTGLALTEHICMHVGSNIADNALMRSEWSTVVYQVLPQHFLC